MSKPKHSLHGWQIVVLRPPQQAMPLKEWIEAQGAKAICCPTLDIKPSSFTPEELNGYSNTLLGADYLIISSQNAISCLPEKLTSVIAKSQLKIFTMGEATSEAAKKINLTPYYTAPSGATSETLLALSELQANVLKNKKIVLLAGSPGRQLLKETLAKRGAEVQALIAYTQQLPLHVDLAWQAKHRPTIIIATSLNALTNLLLLTPLKHHGWLFQQCVLGVSERIAKSANESGFQHTIAANGTSLVVLALALQTAVQIGNTK